MGVMGRCRRITSLALKAIITPQNYFALRVRQGLHPFIAPSNSLLLTKHWLLFFDAVLLSLQYHLGSRSIFNWYCDPQFDELFEA